MNAKIVTPEQFEIAYSLMCDPESAFRKFVTHKTELGWQMMEEGCDLAKLQAERRTLEDSIWREIHKELRHRNEMRIAQ